MRYATTPTLIIFLTTAIGIAHAAEPWETNVVASPSTPMGPTYCPEGKISNVEIINHEIFNTDDPSLPSYLHFAYRTANRLHIRTRHSVIERDLLFSLGDCYDPDIIAESERLLRENDFLASARIYDHLQDDGTRALTVETRDDWSTQLDIRTSLEDRPTIYGINLRETNFLGLGHTAELYYSKHRSDREVGLSYQTHQLGASNWRLGGAAGVTRTGLLLSQSLTLPFREEAGRWAFHQGYERHDRYFEYQLGYEEVVQSLLRPIRSETFDLTLVRRLGEPGSLILFGTGLRYTNLRYPKGDSEIVLIEDTDYDDPIPIDEGDHAALETIRRQNWREERLDALFLIGARRIRWVERAGFDSLEGAEDIPLGLEAGLTIGRSVRGWHRHTKLFSALHLYTAIEWGGLLMIGRGLLDLERQPQSGDGGWREIHTSAEGFIYRKPDGATNTTLLRTELRGGWKTMTPFQLTLGGDFGIRGYPRTSFPGGGRLLITIEERRRIDTPLREIADLGFTTFIDIGKVWPGDAPFGVHSEWRGSLGAGLRIALPAGNRRTYRLDLAAPLIQGLGWRDLRLILSVGEYIGFTPNSRKKQVESLQRARPTNPFNR